MIVRLLEKQDFASSELYVLLFFIQKTFIVKLF